MCARVKQPERKPHAPLDTVPVYAPLDRLATDLPGLFPESVKGYKYVLVVADYFTKLVEIFAVPDQSMVTWQCYFV